MIETFNLKVSMALAALNRLVEPFQKLNDPGFWVHYFEMMNSPVNKAIRELH